MEARLALSSLGVGTASMGSLTTSKWLGALTIEPESNEYFELILDTFQNGFFFFTLTWMKIAKRKKKLFDVQLQMQLHYCNIIVQHSFSLELVIIWFIKT